MSYVYIPSEPGLFTVGHYDPLGGFLSESDHGTTDLASARVHYLNGGAATADRQCATCAKTLTGDPALTLCQECMSSDFPEDSYGDTALCCPKCDYMESFYVEATKSVTVNGNDYTEILNDDSDTEYGAASTCTCVLCGHVGTVAQFRRADQE